jgi:hypothetical protein
MRKDRVGSLNGSCRQEATKNTGNTGGEMLDSFLGKVSCNTWKIENAGGGRSA